MTDHVPHDGAAVGGASPMPEADVDLDEAVVRRLLERAVADQDLDPELAGRDVRFAANGWDNALFRLGDSHVIRIPRRAASVELVGNEQRWLPDLAPHLPVPVPTPVFAAAATVEFDRPWSIVPWFDGDPIAERLLPDRQASRLAADLAAFLHALHRPSPPDAPANPVRGVPLGERAERTAAHLQPGTAAMNSISPPEADRIRAWWELALSRPVWDRRPRWIHGDLHPLNILWSVDDERLVAVIDFGDLTGGDPATDLAVAWYLFPDPAQRRRFREAARIDDEPVDAATWVRAAGWALAVSAAIVANSADHPVLFHLGVRTLQAVAAADPDD